MLHGKRSAAWDHTATLLLTIRKVVGDKTITWDRLHPYAKEFESQTKKKQAFREFNNRFRKNK